MCYRPYNFLDYPNTLVCLCYRASIVSYKNPSNNKEFLFYNIYYKLDFE